MKKIKILVVSYASWSLDNSFGNTFSNLFEGIDNLEFAHIYVRPGMPSNNMKNIKYLHITDKDLVKNLKNKNHIVGKKVENVEAYVENNENYVEFAKNNRCGCILLFREFLWQISRWQSKELLNFINDFKPDLVYCHINKLLFLNNIIFFVKKYCNVPMIGHLTDDYYSKKNYGLDVFSYIYEHFVRKSIFRIIKQCEFVDCFSALQKEEYEKIFNVPFKVRYKSANIHVSEIKKEYNNPLEFLYTGNLGYHRWQNLVEIGKVLDKINENGVKAILNIYSGTKLTNEMKEAFAQCLSLNFKGSVSGQEVQKLQSKADILIHTEAFNKIERKKVRMSLSTKIIDYLAKGKCILAYGPQEVESMNYIEKNDCGFTIYKKDDLFDKINILIENKNLIYDYSTKALEVAKKNHNPEKLQKVFEKDLLSLIK